MANANSHGNYVVETAAEMAAFDRLPKAVRQALANSPEDSSAHSLTRAARDRKWKQAEMLRAIELRMSGSYSRDAV